MEHKHAVKAEAPVKGPVNAGSVVKGELVFQRVGQGMAAFKAVSDKVISNPLIQVPITLLPEDYAAEKYDVTGTFEYRINVKAKPKAKAI